MSRAAARDAAALVETGEAAAYADMYGAAAAAGHAERYGLSVKRDGAAVALIASRVPSWMLNRVLCLDVGEPATKSIVAAYARVYADAGLPCAIQTSPATPRAAEVAGWLRDLGAAPGRTWAKMWRDDRPATAPAGEPRVEIATPELAATVAGIACAAFGMPQSIEPFFAALVGAPGWHAYLAFVDDAPVATGMLHVGDGVGWLGVGAALAAGRGKGAHRAIMARRIADGIALGCRQFVTETGVPLEGEPNPSYNNMVRNGFVRVHDRPTWLLEP